MKLEFSRQIFEKYSNVELYESTSDGSRVAPCGLTERYDEANSFGNFANALINELILLTTKKKAVYSEGVRHPLSYRFQCMFLGLQHLLVKRCYG